MVPPLLEMAANLSLIASLVKKGEEETGLMLLIMYLTSIFTLTLVVAVSIGFIEGEMICSP